MTYIYLNINSTYCNTLLSLYYSLSWVLTYILQTCQQDCFRQFPNNQQLVIGKILISLSTMLPKHFILFLFTESAEMKITFNFFLFHSGIDHTSGIWTTGTNRCTLKWVEELGLERQGVHLKDEVYDRRFKVEAWLRKHSRWSITATQFVTPLFSFSVSSANHRIRSPLAL